MSMFNDIDRGKRGNKENCIANAHRLTEYSRKFMRGHWSFRRPGSEKKWHGTHVCKPDGQWDEVVDDITQSLLNERINQQNMANWRNEASPSERVHMQEYSAKGGGHEVSRAVQDA